MCRPGCASMASETTGGVRRQQCQAIIFVCIEVGRKEICVTTARLPGIAGVHLHRPKHSARNLKEASRRYPAGVMSMLVALVSGQPPPPPWVGCWTCKVLTQRGFRILRRSARREKPGRTLGDDFLRKISRINVEAEENTRKQRPQFFIVRPRSDNFERSRSGIGGRMMNRKFTIAWSRLDINFAICRSGMATCTPTGKGVNAGGKLTLVTGFSEHLEADILESLRIIFEMGDQKE